MNFNWTCRHCQHPQVGSEANYAINSGPLLVGNNEFGVNLGYRVVATACQNQLCKKITFQADIHLGQWRAGEWKKNSDIKFWQLLPESSAKPQPEYIPKALRDDYFEACRIMPLSPKSSATLARRVLQGMIRDFCGVIDGTLDREITKLAAMVKEEKAPRGVTPESVEAIDHVRKIGNIGAHMERDINLIIDIEPEEAQILIDLVETLFDEWYVAREQRAKRFKGVADLRAAKDAEKTGKPKA